MHFLAGMIAHQAQAVDALAHYGLKETDDESIRNGEEGVEGCRVGAAGA
jgi:uncharacterized protein (DUF305 family)